MLNPARNEPYRRPGLWFAGAAVATVVLLAVPALSFRLIDALQSDPPLSAADLSAVRANVIVVLSAGRNPNAPEYEAGVAPDALYLERLRYGAFLARRTKLPVLVSGGFGNGHAPSLAAIGGEVLKHDFQIPTVLMEEHSRTTAENAQQSSAILQTAGWRRVLLVTHAWHMPRAKAAFEAAGLEVVPAPTAFAHYGDTLSLDSLTPSPRGLAQSYYALHEWLGRLWYALRYGHNF
ncbi:YdcF family protein [Azospirillum canadense]|uniref:YdcF family protein n=1 Tax=Azospirillum canadense TaxID=403962 RepID=UPI0022261A2A|nr:YdcF family protein [Azospirillum canadense]MCW2240932.1 uncharacterized SAM-binding protein YcdF (DUF218 family) [Azospirillum canadense]